MKKINENTKVTLTLGQLKKLVKESVSPTGTKKLYRAISSMKKAYDSLMELTQDESFAQFYDEEFHVPAVDALKVNDVGDTYEWLVSLKDYVK